jgi:cell wall-associated NlpC family hydrolase
MSYSVTDTRRHLYLVSADGTTTLLDQLLVGCNREKLYGELPRRLTAHLAEGQIVGLGSAMAACQNGARTLYYTSRDRGVTWVERFRGVIWDWDPSDDGTEFTLTCYDDLIYLDSEDQRIYEEGMTGAQILTDVFDAWGIPIGAIEGPAVTMPRIAWSGKLKDLVTYVLGHAIEIGDRGYDCTMDQGLVYVRVPGQDAPIYEFDQGSTAFKYKDKQSLKGVANEVLVVGNKGAKTDRKRQTVSSTVITSPTDQQLGGRMRTIVQGSRYHTQAAADTAAETELQKRSQQSRDRSASVAYVDEMDRGYVVSMYVGTLQGHFTVLGVSHDEDALTMELKLGDDGTPLWIAQKAPSSQAGALGASGSGLDAALQFARANLGTPYVWAGGHGPGWTPGTGWDCSGMVDQAYAAAGIPGLGWSGTGGIDAATVVIPASQARPGDLIRYDSPQAHVAMVSDRPGYMIEAQAPGVGTVESPIRPGGTYRHLPAADNPPTSSTGSGTPPSKSKKKSKAAA